MENIDNHFINYLFSRLSNAETEIENLRKLIISLGRENVSLKKTSLSGCHIRPINILHSILIDNRYKFSNYIKRDQLHDLVFGFNLDKKEVDKMIDDLIFNNILEYDWFRRKQFKINKLC